MNLTRNMALVIITAMAVAHSEGQGFSHMESEVTIVRCINAFYPDLLKDYEYLPCVKQLREKFPSPS
jgi:hypothetical protein